MGRQTNLERYVQYEDELAEMRKAGQEDTEQYKNLEKMFKELQDMMPKYRPHVYANVRAGKNKGIKKKGS